ncbi:hypothetical protein HPP92_000499 [Vanilla planifolia]|uniref:SP-RING-type domain-containing protein n=1 Tax=Vanilla planifolia TaxID=51239 RepID=A0A835SA96_VANPL|nr:hypothetical protein HPP92_000499 [Vanilla planifolia]
MTSSHSSTAVAAAIEADSPSIVSFTSTVPMISSSPVEQANSIRLLAVYERLSFYLKDISLFEASDAIFLCYSLARGIDCAITHNSIPGIASRLPSLVKKVYEWRKNAAFLSAIMMVLISAKNACKRGWFQPADSKELLFMVDEICNKFCTEVHSNSHVGHAFDTISKIIPKFCPHVKLCSLIASFEAQPGYDVLMLDFYFTKNHFPEEKIVLIVIKTENLETSSCIAGPAQVSFIINGKGVDKRNNVSLDYGPQFPTDISKMLKYGINVLQAIGYFDGTYLIAIAYMSRMTTCTPVLKEYVHPAVTTFDTDSELFEGPSRISLCCPISFKRIKTPVKGHLCKHHQCFDYDNYIEMNSRKPNWRCPHCNQPICLVDLRIDRKMVKILEEMGDVTEVLIHSDGSWNVVPEHEKYTANQLPVGTHVQSNNMECETIMSTDSIADPVDLTMEDNCNGCTTQTHGQEVPLNGSANQMSNKALESEDRKPLIGVEELLVTQFLSDTLLPSYTSNATHQNVNNLEPTYTPSYASNGLAACAMPNGGALQTVPPNIMGSMVSPALDATQRSVHAVSAVNTVTGRNIPRHVDRTPIAFQALPAQQTPSASERLQTNLIDVPLVSNNLSPTIYQTVHTSMATLENFCGGISNMDMHQVARAVVTAVTQDLGPQSNPYVLNSAARQQVAGLPSPSSINPRPLLSQRTGPNNLDALRTTMQPPSYFQNPLQTPPAFRTQPSISQAANIPSFSPTPLPPVRLTSPANFMNHLNPTQANHLAQLLRSQTSSAAREGSRVLGADRWRSLTGLTPSLHSRTDGIPVLPEQNWRPTRRMRGSLTGSEYSAVLNHYMAPSSQFAGTRPLATSAAEQVSVMIANNLTSQVTGNHRSGFEPGELGTQRGDATI